MRTGDYMPERKKIIVTAGVVFAAAVLVILEIIALITDTFVIDVIIHAYIHLLLVPIFIRVLRKCFKGQLTDSMNKAVFLCGAMIFLEFVIVDSIRFALLGGISTILFLPACLPLCFMIIVHYSAKDTGRDKKYERRLTYAVGIPLLMFSLYFEISSFL